jgi:protein-S-isoprenylcysteine O-methyltransferase Ste14
VRGVEDTRSRSSGETDQERPGAPEALRLLANFIGAAGAAYFAYVTLQSYFVTHRPIGILFFAEQAVVVVVYLIRRPARVVTRRPNDWMLAFAGTFCPVLLRPTGAHLDWAFSVGFWLQLVGVIICLWSLSTLGRSFGFAPADRGVVSRGPYAFVRHPVYGSYVLLQTGYLLQSISLRNVLVVVLATAANIGRARAEERVLLSKPTYAAYRRRVRWGLVPGVW